MSEIFDLKSVPLENKCSKSHAAELIYQNSTHLNSESRYVVELPLRNDSELGNSTVEAFKAFYGLENQFSKKSFLQKEVHRTYE